MGETKSFIGKHNKQIAIAAGVLGVFTVVATGLYVIKITQNRAVVETPSTEEKTITSVSALGRIEPLGEVINIAPTPSMAGAKVKNLLVDEGSEIKEGDIIAITSDYDSKQAEVEKAQKDLKVAQTNLAIVQAGAKQGTIEAQRATIARLNVELEGAIATDRAKITRLKAQLATETKEKQATIDRFKAEVDNAQIEFQRYQKLADDGVISTSELDQKKLVLATNQQWYQEAQASYNRTITTVTEEINEAQAFAIQQENTLKKQIVEAQAKLDEIAEIRTVDIAQAQAEVERVMAIIKQAQIDLDLTMIKAPIDGTIIDIIAHEGENIENSQGVVEMGNTSQMLVIAEVYESDISKVRVGQSATIVSENNSFPDPIEGKVLEISTKIGKKDVLETDPAASVDARVVEVKIVVNPKDNVLVQNLIYSQVIVEILL